MSKRVSFKNLILGSEPVQKGATDPAQQTEYEYRDGMLQRVEPDMDLTAPQPDDATVEPVYPASSFPMTASIVDRIVAAAQGSLTPPSVYDLREGPDVSGAGTVPSQFQPLAPGKGEMFSPANFKAPVPTDRTNADDADPGDQDENISPWAHLADEDDDADVDAMKKSTKSLRLGLGYLMLRKMR